MDSTAKNSAFKILPDHRDQCNLRAITATFDQPEEETGCRI